MPFRAIFIDIFICLSTTQLFYICVITLSLDVWSYFVVFSKCKASKHMP